MVAPGSAALASRTTSSQKWLKISCVSLSLTGSHGHPKSFSAIQFSSAQSLSHVRLFASPWTTARQASLFITNSWSLLKLMSLSRWCHPTISSSVTRFSSCPQSSQHQDFFQWVGSSCQVAKVLELLRQSFQWIFRADFLYDCHVCAPCCPRDSQESSPAPQFESISSLMLSLLYGLALTSIHDYWKNHSFDCTDRCHQSDVSAF